MPSSAPYLRTGSKELLDGEKVTENRVGKGRVIYRARPLSEILTAMTPPDFDYCRTGGKRACAIPAGTTGEADLYFVADANREAATDAVVRFRVRKSSEFLEPSTGAITKPAVYRQLSGVTEAPMISTRRVRFSLHPRTGQSRCAGRRDLRGSTKGHPCAIASRG